MIKRYKQGTTAIYLIIVPLFSFLILSNLDSVKPDNLLLMLIIGVATLFVLLVSIWQSYIEIDSDMLKQKSWFFFQKQISIHNLDNVQYDSKYESFISHNGYMVFMAKDSDEIVMAVNPRSYKPSVMSEFLSDLQRLNENIKFDNQVQKIKAGKLLG
jgi:competence protein ComGF